MNNYHIFLTCIAVVSLFMVFQKWFWIIVFGISFLASAYSVLASIIHFEILEALGFTLIAGITGKVASVLVDSYD